MARLTVYRDNRMDSTVVSNCFIDEFMKDANDTQLKVYLYLIRMLNANQAVSVSEIADKFNETEKEIMRALKYWETKELLVLDYDSTGDLTGIHMNELTEQKPSSPRICLSSQSAAPETVSVAEQDSFCGQPALNASAPAQPSFEKPSYSADQLRAFRDNESTAQLLFIAQSYFGKPLTVSEMKSILFFTEELHFSEDLVDYLLQYCLDRGKKDFRYIERVAINWAQQGVTTPEEAQRFSCRYDKSVYAIMNQLGKNTSPTMKEMEYITRWVKEFGFTSDIIFEACERTVLATDSHRFEYADGILSSWHKAGVHHKADILKMDELHKQRRANAVKAPCVNRFNQFAQNDYDFEALERELISN